MFLQIRHIQSIEDRHDRKPSRRASDKELRPIRRSH